MVLEKNPPGMVGFQLKNHHGCKQISQMTDSGEIGNLFNFKGYVEQYLPNRYPYEDYLQYYFGKMSLSACLILDLCHERYRHP